MKFDRIRLIVLCLVMSLVFMTQAAKADVEDPVVKNFYSSYCKSRGIDYVKIRGMFDSKNATVASFIAGKAKISPEKLHKIYVDKGRDWSKVMLHLNVDMSSLFLPVPSGYKVGPPYGKAYGYWKKHKNQPNYKIKMSFNDIYNLVNLHMIYKHTNTPVVDIIKMRGNGRDFNWIIKQTYGHGMGSGHGQGHSGDQGHGQGQGHGHGKDKNK